MISRSVKDTGSIATDILALITVQRDSKPHGGATVVALSGDLGSGKTTFAKYFAAALGIPPESVTSPTFVIEKRFDIVAPTAPAASAAHQAHFSKFIHIDAYRLEKAQEIEKLGWAETVSDPRNLILIEWPEHIGAALPPNAVRVSFKTIDEHTREIDFK